MKKKKNINFKKKMNSLMKNKNFIIAICVFALTILTIGISYASFFSIKTNNKKQNITTGTLAVSYGQESSSIMRNNMSSMSDEMGMHQGESSIIYIQNTGTLNSTFSLNIGYDMENFTKRSGYSNTDLLTPIDYIRFAVFECSGNACSEENLKVGPLSIADLPIERINSDSRYNRYKVLFDVVGGTNSPKATKTYKVKMWLSDEATPAASYSYFYVNTEIVAEVENAKMAYNITGTLSGHDTSKTTKVVLQNGSATSNVTSNNFTLTGIYPGTYNIEIINGSNVFDGNLTVIEGSQKSISNLGTTFQGTDIYNVANNNGTTINKIKKANSITEYSSAISLNSGVSYNLPFSAKLTGASEETININVTLNSTSKKITSINLK